MHVNDIVKKVNENGGFWQLQVRDLIYVVAVIAAASSFLLGQTSGKVKRDDEIDNRITALATTVSTQTEGIKAQNQRINDMDTKGTQQGIAAANMQIQKNLETDRRIGIMEAIATASSGDVREIKTKMEFVVNYLNEAGGKKK